MKTYRVNTYNDKTTYDVTIDDEGVVDVDGLLPNSAEALKESVARYVEQRGLMPVVALGLAIGSYSHLTEVEDDG